LFASSSVGTVTGSTGGRFTFPSGSHFSAGDFITFGWRCTASSLDKANGQICWIYNTLAEVSASF